MSFQYNSMTDSDASEKSFMIHEAPFTQKMNPKTKKRQTKEDKTSKKNKKQKFQSYMETLQKEYEEQNPSVSAILENNLIKVEKPSGGNFTIKFPASEGEEYWTFQHYRTSEIKNLKVENRWRACKFSMKIITPKLNETGKNSQLVLALNHLKEIGMNEFMSNPEKKIDSFKSPKKFE